jgi:hypothetical protein
MLGSALLEARTGIAPVASTLSERDAPNPMFVKAISLFDPLPTANDNPRSITEELASRLSNAQRELSLVSMYLTPAFCAATMRQLGQLLDPESWDEEDKLLDVWSFRSFARAMAVLRPSIRPMLGLSPKGNLLAMWGSDTTRLSFEHLAGDELKWFVHLRSPDDHDLAAGTTHIGRIPRILGAHLVGPLIYGAG